MSGLDNVDNDAKHYGTMEPKDYFVELKSKISEVQFAELETNKAFIAKELEKAHLLGQKSLTHKASFMWEVLEKEMILHAMGIKKYVHRGDVVKLIDNVEPKNSVKIVELDNFPRSVPDENLEDIIKARDLNLFDVLLVVYTDLTDEEVHTVEQKEFVARNRDPIVFGMFVDNNLSIKHDRLYFITDWEDEYCDLTFTKMIEKMSNIGIKKPEKNISVDSIHINEIITKSRVEIDSIKLNSNNTWTGPKPKVVSIKTKIMNMFGFGVK